MAQGAIHGRVHHAEQRQLAVDARGQVRVVVEDAVVARRQHAALRRVQQAQRLLLVARRELLA